MKIKLYNCFHDSGSMPDSKYLSDMRPALLCGTDIEYRNNHEITGVLKDNTGDNISKENLQYSELTGYYWVWKNENVDIVGIEHYRRHFIKHIPIENHYVKPENLLDEQDILTMLESHDFIVPVPQILANTSIYDLYVICFHDQAKDIVKYMRDYFTSKNLNNYVDALYNYMSRNILYRANMLITYYKEFDEYCSVMFDMIDYMKEHMPVKENSRVWGYVTELFPMIYLQANKKTFIEADTAVDDFNMDLQKQMVYTTMENTIEPFDKDPNIQIEFFKNL